MPDAHSLLVGGSIAARRIACPASFQESLRAPPQTGSTIYAAHGSALHVAITDKLRNPKRKLVGRKYLDHIVTQEDLDELLEPADLALDELQHLCGPLDVVGEELRVQVPAIPGAFGTLDLLLQSGSHSVIADFKFGSGVKVDILDADGSPNSQLLFYLLGAIRHIPPHHRIIIAIIQPAFSPALGYVEVTRDQVADFERRLVDAIANALSASPRRARGEHCRWAPCKTTCSLWTGPLLDLSAIGVPTTTPVQPNNNDWGIFLSRAKRLVDSAVQYKAAIDDMLIEHLRAGGKAPGFGVKLATKNRKWLDDVDLVAKSLKKLGLPDDKIWQRKLQTFTVTDAAAKRLGVTIPDALRPKPPTTDLVLTAEDDPNALDMGLRQQEFSAALKALKQE